MTQQNKEEQKKLLIEIMESDQKSGLYENHIGDTNKMVTAVEWLYERIERMIPNTPLYNQDKIQYLEQAKELDKQQKKECWNVAHQAGRFEGKGIAEENWQSFEQYYKETYENK